MKSLTLYDACATLVTAEEVLNCLDKVKLPSVGHMPAVIPHLSSSLFSEF
jgi:hypothetical protein